MINKNISFDFDPKIDSKSVLTKLVNDAYLKNKKFFGENVSGIKIIFLYTRAQMDKSYERKTEDWEVGYAKDMQHIYIFSPSVFDKASNHIATDFSYVLTHELAHIFTFHLLDFSYPKWLHEGIAGYVAEQYKIRPVQKVHDFSQLHDSENWNYYHNFPQAFSFTKYLIDTLKRKKMLQFLKQLPKNVSRRRYPYKEFLSFFNQFFNLDFNQLVDNWKKTLKLPLPLSA